MTMNLTGFELKAGQQVTVKIEDDKAVDVIAQLQKQIADLTARLEQVEGDIEILYSDEETDEDEEYNPFAELDTDADEEDDSNWNSWFEPLISSIPEKH